MDDSCRVGEGLNCFKVWVYLHLMYCWGDVSQHGCMKNLPTISGLLGDSSSPFSKKFGLRGRKFCIYLCACAHRDPIYLSCPYSLLTIEKNIFMCSYLVVWKAQLLPVMQ